MPTSYYMAQIKHQKVNGERVYNMINIGHIDQDIVIFVESSEIKLNMKKYCGR